MRLNQRSNPRKGVAELIAEAKRAVITMNAMLQCITTPEAVHEFRIDVETLKQSIRKAEEAQ